MCARQALCAIVHNGVMANHEPTTDGGCGQEPAPSPELRDALTLLREHSDDAEFRTLVDDVLAGRCSLLDASGTTAFSNVVFAGIAQKLSQLNDAEKRSLTTPAEPAAEASESTTGSCGLPCATCTSLCAFSQAHPGP